VGIFPFFVIDLIVIVLLSFFPDLATWLPNKMIGPTG
jgi:TRAP-type C4-dicarboxylate transport system permease large subunit